MGLFGPSKSELEDRIFTLEERLDIAEREARNAKEIARRAREDAEENARAALEIAKAYSNVGDEVPDKSGEVITLDEPAIGWKGTNESLAKLLLPAGTTVVYHDARTISSAAGYKLRANQAIVLEFRDVDMQKAFDGPYRDVSEHHSGRFELTDTSSYDNRFKYTVGEKVIPDKFDTSLSESCTHGIHFFRTIDEAHHFRQRWIVD